MGEGYGGLKRREVNFVFGFVFGVVVSHINFRAALKPSVHVFERECVYGENAVLRARLYRHVAHGEPVVHREVFYAVAEELHRFIQRAVDAYHSYYVENEVFAAHVFRGLAAEDEFYRRRHLKPAFARHHARRHIGRADARRERAERAVSAGVAVGAYHEVARAHKPLFGQQRVFYAHRADVEKVFEVLFACELAAQLALLRALDVFIGREVVHDQRDFRPVGNFFGARLFEFLYCDGARYVVGKHEVELCVYKLARLNFFKLRVRRQNLLRHRHRHSGVSP